MTNPTSTSPSDYAHYADPYKAAMKAIHRMYADEPDLEALFIGQVFDMMQAEIQQEQEAARHA